MQYTISFNGANFVARETGWHMTGGWGQGNDAAEAYFRPIATFEQRFSEVVAEVRRLGFTGMDLWTAHLHYSWATPEHIATAKKVLAEYDVSVPTIAGSFGSTREQFRSACQLAHDLGASVLAGIDSGRMAETDRDYVTGTLREFDLRVGLENHPERTSAEMIEHIGAEPGGRIGTAVDTGWYGTQGYDAAQAIRELDAHVVAVHLKDIRAQGEHDTCRFGDGIVPVQDCVRALTDIGYTGPISIEHEPYTYNPASEIVVCREMLESWLSEQAG